MKFKGGVIIIGSLIWENNLIRKNWRDRNLLDDRKLTKVPIRYGRESRTRKGIYTMVFSKSCENNLGQGIILPFKEEIKSFETIERQAFALAIAEGIYKNDNLRITSSWGSVGLLINPELKEKDAGSFALIKNKWSDIYNNYRDTFNYENYKTKEETESVITRDGFLNISWQADMQEFDLLIATPVVPKPKTILTPLQIASKINLVNDSEYFSKNRENQIETVNDNEILKNIHNQLNSDENK